MNIEDYVYETSVEELTKAHTVKQLRAMYEELTGVDHFVKSVKKQHVAEALKRNVRARRRGDAFANM